jgi:hypothetical protein
VLTGRLAAESDRKGIRVAKKTTAASKTPSAKVLKAEIRTDERKEAADKHAAARSRNAATRKHLIAKAGALGKKVKTLKHELADKTSSSSSSSKTRSWSPDEDVALCSARAVAESLRIALGVPVSHDDVLALYWLVADDADAGISILDGLEAAQAWSGPVPVSGRLLCPATFRDPPEQELASSPGYIFGQPLILGLDLPDGQGHAVTVAPDGTWWSWGEPHAPADFPGAVIDEAWAVTW